MIRIVLFDNFELGLIHFRRYFRNSPPFVKKG